MKVLYIIIFAVISVILLAISTKERYLSSTYVMTPQTSGVYPTNITDFYWWDRYIRKPYVNYAAIPYGGWGYRQPWRRHPRRWWF